MGYACPVCGAPQVDGEHLANHLAFSALLGHDDHGDWLDDHSPGWDGDDPEALAERVTPHAEEMDLPVETSTSRGEREAAGPDAEPFEAPPGDGAVERRHSPGAGAPSGDRELDTEAREILAEARRLTERRRSDDGEDG
ncbi:MAG: DUF5810 domain-containing protein [Halobacteriales archaeon]